MSHPVGLGHRACPWPYQSCSCDFQSYIPPQEKTMSTISDREAVPILRHFEYAHLPMNQSELVRDFYQFAHHLTAKIQNGPERQVALRKLLEAKDAAVRAVLEES